MTALPADRPWAGPAADADLATSYRPAAPVDLARTLRILAHGGGDPTFGATLDGAVWRTTGFDPGLLAPREAHRRHPGLRIPRTGRSSRRSCPRSSSSA